MTCSFRGRAAVGWSGSVAGKLAAGDPGREEVVRMLGEVVADEHVEQVRVAAQVCLGQRDQLSVAGRRRVLGRPA